MGLNLEDVAVGVGDDSDELEEHVLRLHVESKGKGQRLGLAGVDLKVVLDRRQVAQDALVRGCVGGQLLGRGQDAANKGDLDGVDIAVGHLDERLGRSPVDELHAKDVGIRERRGDVGGELAHRWRDGLSSIVLKDQN